MLRNVAILSFYIALSSCGNEDDSGYKEYPHQSDPCEFFETTEDLSIFWLGIHDRLGPDVRLQIPQEYFNPRSSAINYRNAVLDGAVLIRVRLEDFAPWSTNIVPENKIYPRLNGNILYQPVDDLTANLVIQMGLTYSRKPDISLADISDKGAISKYELVEFPGRPIANERIFAAVKNDTITDLITCHNKDLARKHPSCSHIFRYKNIGVKLSYSLPDLKLWQAYRMRAEEFTSCAYIQSQ